ncbi:MAG: hypothetical protein WCP60_07225 [bacterium]
MKKLSSLLLLVLAISGCNSLQKKEQLLSVAGFRSVTPSTPAQTARLKSLPQGHLTPVSKNGKTLFVLADAKQNRLFVGNQAQYQAYKQLRLSNQLSRDQRATADLNADATAEWEAWGGLDTPFPSPDPNY